MNDQRPDPDILLDELRREAERGREGQLKIFFGAAPGVGKTYAMLEAARQKRAEGFDVVAGLVETHGRRETAALLEGMETIPRQSIEYRGAHLHEFDVDAALARNPAIILVDELAHTNVEGSRHKKRWQDIYELLGAGISVFTTVNVQHLESLNDVVAQITGVRVRETVPDFLLDRADEIELIDLPPEDLLQRLAEGKVYVAELAERALKNFFRKGNLLALRELALRRTAERVDAQMRDYRRIKGVEAVWPATERILVCVGPSPFALRLIRAAKRMASGLHAEWIAVTVEAPAKIQPTEHDIRKLAGHMQLAESLGAETVFLSGYKASEEILSFARSRNVTKIIIGKPTHPRWKDKLFGSMLDEIVRGSGEIDVHVISGDQPSAAVKAGAAAGTQPVPLRDWLISLAGIGICTGAGFLMFPHFALVDIAMVYILGVVVISSRTGSAASLLASILSVAAFDFFFVPPYFTFAVSDIKYIVTFVVMFIVAIITSRLTLRIRHHAQTARRREMRTAALYRLSKELVHEQTIEDLSGIASRHISEVFSRTVTVLVLDAQGHLGSSGGGEAPAFDDREMSVARWAFDHAQRAGAGTDTLPGASGLYLPLVAASRTVGVLGIMGEPGQKTLDPEQMHALENFAYQTAMAIERAYLAEEAQGAMLKAETESLRNTLLSSLSHDLRTPLATITGASTTLLQQDRILDRRSRLELIQTITEESERLNRLIRNVLDMTRIESGAISVNKEWQSFEEIVGTVLHRLSEKLKDRRLVTEIPADLPLVRFDPILIEQVLMNLFENALKYTPAGTLLELKASTHDDALMIELADRGPGIPPGEEERIFDKFMHGGAMQSGIGLGLAICRAIVHAHGGRIWAENRGDGGAIFRFTLPIGDPPPSIDMEKDSGAGG
ncbi:MAG TPA: sensor histidine kinase KdpD [Dissulfurispiraceae bacterium]|nr:sensor histidine kinase KdpD [Dissulfurispiraceae bacterium]